MRVLTLMHFGLFLLWFLAMVAGTFLERWILAKHNPRFGFILPVLNFALAIFISIPNFVTAWRIYLSIPAFIAAVIIFVFFNLPTILFMLMTIQALDDERARWARRRSAKPLRRNLDSGQKSRRKSSAPNKNRSQRAVYDNKKT